MHISLEKHWWKPRLTWLTIWLTPISLLYGLVAKMRYLYLNKFSSAQIYTPPVPTLIVGNIVVGGAGKTPIVIALVNYLKDTGHHPAVISRGYGAKIGGEVLRVDAEAMAKFTDGFSDDVARDASAAPETLPDEPLMIAQATDVPVYCHPKRSMAAQLAILEGATILISDDGLQHYYLGRHIEIGVHPARYTPYGNGWLLPAGPLRELPARLDRCDYLLWRSGEHQSNADSMIKNHINYAYTVSKVCPILKPKDSVLIQDFNFAQKILAFSGLANNHAFHEVLDSLGAQNKACIAYPDHHTYTLTEVKELIGRAVNEGAILLTTAKDMVKIKPLLLQIKGNHFLESNRLFYYLEMRVDLPDSFYHDLDNKIAQCQPILS